MQYRGNQRADAGEVVGIALARIVPFQPTQNAAIDGNANQPLALALIPPPACLRRAARLAGGGWRANWLDILIIGFIGLVFTGFAWKNLEKMQVNA